MALNGILFVFFPQVSFPILDAGRQCAHTQRGSPTTTPGDPTKDFPHPIVKRLLLLQSFLTLAICGVGLVLSGRSVTARAVCGSEVTVLTAGYWPAIYLRTRRSLMCS